MWDFAKWFVRYAVTITLALAAGRYVHADPLRIDGPKSAEPYKLVILSPKGDVGGAALVWDISPEDRADVVELPDGRLVLTGPPGEYKARLRSIRAVEGKTTVETARWAFSIGQPSTAPPGTGKPRSMVPDAIGKLTVGRSGCTATAIYPRRADGRWDVLTASHCTGGPGTKGLLSLKDGREFTLTVTNRQTGSDITWFVTDQAVEDMPYCVLAGADPEPGTAVWQAGYGEDRPTVRKEGTVIGVESNGQLSFRLSVSRGDSGGPIFRSDTGEVVACVCCTLGLAQKTTMYGGSCSTAARLRAGSLAVPLQMDAEPGHPGCFHPVLSAVPGHFLMPLRRPEFGLRWVA